MIIRRDCVQGGDAQPLSPTSVERVFASNCDALLDAAGLVDEQQVLQQQGGQIRQPGVQVPAPAAQQQQQAGGRVVGMPALPASGPSLPTSAVKDMRSGSQASLGQSPLNLQPGALTAPSSSMQPIPATAAAAVTASAMRPRPALSGVPPAVAMAGATGASHQSQAAGLLALHPALRPGQSPAPRPRPILATPVHAPAAGQFRGPGVQQPRPNIIVSQQRPLLVQQPQTHIVVQQPWPIAMQQPRPTAAAQQARPQAVQQPGPRPLLDASRMPRPITVLTPGLPGPQLRLSAPSQAPVRPGAVYI